MSLNTALATAGHSLQVFTAGMQVAGQNISNAGTPGYIREELQLEPGIPFHSGGLILGTGVLASGVQQQIDKFLEYRIYAANGDLQESSTRQIIYQRLETELRELGAADLSTQINQFLADLNEVVNQPESAELRQLAIRQGEQLAGEIVSLRSRLDTLRESQSTVIDALVKEANVLIDRIGELNTQIVSMEAGGTLGSDAGALRSQRYDALNRLSEIVSIRVFERDNGAIDVISGTTPLVLGRLTEHLETYTASDRGVPVTYVRFAETQTDIPSAGGELRGLIDGRDAVLGGFIDQLDKYAANLIFEFNRLHASGQGLKGFDSILSVEKIDDPTAVLNNAGLAFTPQHGSFQLWVTNTLNGITETTNIAIDLDGIGADTTLDGLRSAIGGVANVTATITADGRLQISADDNFEIRFADDTSGVLAALGINTFFTGSDSSNMGVNAVVAADHELFAAALGGGASDGSNALRLADWTDRPIEGLSGRSLNEFYGSLVSAVATDSARESALRDGFEGFLESLHNQRDQYSGVSLDEEAIRMLEFQKSFQAAARLISTIDELFTILLNI